MKSLRRSKIATFTSQLQILSDGHSENETFASNYVVQYVQLEEPSEKIWKTQNWTVSHIAPRYNQRQRDIECPMKTSL